MKSILYLRAAHEIVGAKDSKVDKLTVLEACISILEQFDLSPKLLSGQKEPIIHQTIPSLFRIHTMITKLIDSNQVCKEFAKNLQEHLFFYYPNLGSVLVGFSTVHMLVQVTKGFVLKNLEKHKIAQDLILAAHNLAAESEPLILSTSPPTFDEEEDPTF